MYNPFEVFPQNDANDSDFPLSSIKGNCPLCKGNKTATLLEIKIYLNQNPSEIQALGINSESDLTLINGDPKISQSEWIYLCPKCHGQGFVL